MKTLNFTVDAKLLQELGERLVGRPYIALGELIKNSYDADARHVELSFEKDCIRITDDGHGMDEAAFVQRWMRIGTTIKASEGWSPALKRPLTGSKGVGRLSAQLLASSLELQSVALRKPSALLQENPTTEDGIFARIEWPAALKQDDLTDVSVEFESPKSSPTFADGSRHGTTIILRNLAAVWGATEIEALAQEVWALQPPFAAESDPAHSFAIDLRTTFPDIQETFDSQMTALMDIANATIKGRLLAFGETGPAEAEHFVLDIGKRPESAGDPQSSDSPLEHDPAAVRNTSVSRYALFSVSMTGSPNQEFRVEIPDCQIDNFDLEVKIFDLTNRQPRGIKVDVARAYLGLFGGVHIYDNGFRLPYYGPELDWLKLEFDHARRLSRSQLVPEHLQIRNAMQDLPSNKRVFGVANVSTSHEARAAKAQGRRPFDALAIQITRDRLVGNIAFDQLTRATRLSLDLYALARAKSKVRRVLDSKRGPRVDPVGVVRDASAVVESIREQLPAETYQSLRDSIDTIAAEVSVRGTEARAYASLLGALATAGMTSLAYEHEVSKQRGEVTEVARQLKNLAQDSPMQIENELIELADKLSAWATRSNRIRALFRPLLDEESRTLAGRYNAKKLAEDVVKTIAVLARTTEVDTSQIPEALTLPASTSAAWSAILQNLLTNAFRATLTSKPSRVMIDGGTTENGGWLRVQDNGEGGVDLSTAARLFLPFERGQENTERAEALGLGGSGLGLTIVRMITDEIGCKVNFENAGPGWSTSVRIEWSGNA